MKNIRIEVGRCTAEESKLISAAIGKLEDMLGLNISVKKFVMWCSKMIVDGKFGVEVVRYDK